MQVSSVCSKLAEAAADLLSLPGTSLDLCEVKQLPSALGSKLMSSWAVHFSSLEIDETTLDVPGLAIFLAEAAHLNTLHVKCLSKEGSAKLSQLLIDSSTSSLTKLVYSGGPLPAHIPTYLQHLEIDLGPWILQPWRAELLITFLSNSRISLQSLTIDLYDLPLLDCKKLLQPIQDLHIRLQMSELVPISLQWLHRQPYMRLHVELYAYGSDLIQHIQAMLQIQRLPLHRFHLLIGIPCTLNVQRIWHQLELWVPLHLQLTNRVSVHDLQLLPGTPRLHISIDMVFKAEPVSICWNAVAAKPRAVFLELHFVQPGCVLAVSGCSGQIPFQNSKQPWQLCVHGDVEVRGLPASQQCSKATYLLQNKAAIIAGWTEEI